MKKYILLLLIFLFSGCALMNDELIQKNEDTVNSLITHNPSIRSKTIIVTTITNEDNLNKSSTIGRTITEQLITDFIKRGIKVVETRMNKSNVITVRPRNGEFILTRNALNLAKIKNADAILVGTYSSYSHKLYVNIKLIDPTTNIIIASEDYILHSPLINR